MTDDLVKRLRGPAGVKGWQAAFHIYAKDSREAADRIEALEEEVGVTRTEKHADAECIGALENAIDAALAELDASLFTNAEHQRAKDILRTTREATK